MEYKIKNERIELTVSSTGAERSPILFPYVGRFTDGRYTLEGRAYEMDIHGVLPGSSLPGIMACTEDRGTLYLH